MVPRWVGGRGTAQLPYLVSDSMFPISGNEQRIHSKLPGLLSRVLFTETVVFLTRALQWSGTQSLKVTRALQAYMGRPCVVK